LITIFTQAGVVIPGWTTDVIVGALNILVLLGVLSDSTEPGHGFKWEVIKKSCSNAVVWIAVIAWFATFGHLTQWFSFPENLQTALNTTLNMLIFLGVLVSPSQKQ
jgi:uncharacterized membrane protein